MVGLVTVPELATLRARRGCWPMGAIRWRCSGRCRGVLAADPAGDPVYFVDDHFVSPGDHRPLTYRTTPT